MRRLAAIGTVVGAVALWLVLTAAGGGGGGGEYRVDAIFDNASFLIAGQDVRIAGANVGSVTNVKLTRNNQARVQMSIDSRFAPFRSDADCFIAPQSLIGEKFVQCEPGTPSGHELVAQGGQAPTVPVTSTHSPVDPDLVINTFRMPVRARLGLIINELGAGLAGNGDRLNAVLRRASPAIQATDRVLTIVDRDRAVLGRLIDRSDQVIAQLARRSDRVKAFITEANRVSVTAAQRRGAISEGIHRLPATLRETRRSLDALRVLSDRSRPLLPELNAAAGPLATLLGEVPAFSAAARPALRHLAAAARTGTATLRDSGPVVKRLRRFARLAVPVGRLTAALNESLRATGTPEEIETFVYNAALALARFDQSSHILPSFVVGLGDCAAYASTTSPACDAHYAKGGDTSARGRRVLDFLLG